MSLRMSDRKRSINSRQSDLNSRQSDLNDLLAEDGNKKKIKKKSPIQNSHCFVSQYGVIKSKNTRDNRKKYSKGMYICVYVYNTLHMLHICTLLS